MGSFSSSGPDCHKSSTPTRKRNATSFDHGSGVDDGGTSPESIDEASDRERFEEFALRCGLRMPDGATATTPEGVRHAANEIGYPVLVRPSYVLGGEGWRF